jgi:hypothetical protein
MGVRSVCAFVTEHEPNNSIETANPIACGDTVYCAVLSDQMDLDHFRFSAYIRDSIVVRTFSCEGSNTNTYIVLYDDRDSVLAVDDNTGPAEFSEIRYVAPRTGNYIVRVFHFLALTDTSYNLVVNCTEHPMEGYDLCTTPRIIPALPYYNEGSTLGMTSQCGTAAPDVFYRFHNPVSNTLYITVCTDEFDARVQILGRCCNDFFDDADLGCDLGAQLTSYNVAAGDYFILVEGTNANEVGNFTIEVTAQMPQCPAPQEVVLETIGGYPALDWPEVAGPSYFVVWYSSSATGIYDHLGTTFYTYFIDSSGYVGQKRFYKVTSVCPW